MERKNFLSKNANIFTAHLSRKRSFPGGGDSLQIKKKPSVGQNRLKCFFWQDNAENSFLGSSAPLRQILSKKKKVLKYFEKKYLPWSI
jgi:hypothetical protein